MKQDELILDPMQGKSTAFYQHYYRRLMTFCIILCLIGLGQVGYMAINYFKDYVAYEKHYYVSAVDGRLIDIYPNDI